MFWIKINKLLRSYDYLTQYLSCKELLVDITLLRMKRKYIGLTEVELSRLLFLMNEFFLLKVCVNGKKEKKEANDLRWYKCNN